MPRQCQVTGKKPFKGNTYATRGIAKKKKGIGIKVTGKTKRRFLPNLQKKRLWFREEKRFITLTVTPAGLREIDKKGLYCVVNEMRAAGQKI